MTKTRITVCKWCFRVYRKRPFMCGCNSNVFFVETDMDESDVKKLEELDIFADNEEEGLQ